MTGFRHDSLACKTLEGAPYHLDGLLYRAHLPWSRSLREVIQAKSSVGEIPCCAGSASTDIPTCLRFPRSTAITTLKHGGVFLYHQRHRIMTYPDNTSASYRISLSTAVAKV
ncbi:hypothetical protein EDD18DRAFT_1110043 [Armillaria luteobubalina]|uniref:Uncharacterized protein n=1 Tax=Armillaria luteobubalina TaxID=153913 RepID=A0AA39THW2_9AGAR|nr:hypothetical protein EDD18DRAFT_1110043 [Armillaria luteobubalina]